MHLKVSSVTWRPFCLGLNVLILDKLYKASDEITRDTLYLHIGGLVVNYAISNTYVLQIPYFTPKPVIYQLILGHG